MTYPNAANKDRSRRKTIAWFCLYFFVSGVLAPSIVLAADEGIDRDIPIELDSSDSETISMSFDGALLKDALLLFSQQSGLNFVASQEVENRKVTVYFDNVSAKDALNSIITANGLAFSKKPGSNIYIVYPAAKVVQATELITKVIPLKYMRLSSSPLDAAGQVTVGGLSGASGSSSGASGTVASSASSQGSASASVGAGRGADNLVKTFLSPQGKMAIDPITNSLIITDSAEAIATIERILAQVDVPPSQVILEVYVMEVQKSVASDVGISWGGANGALGSFESGMRTTAFPFTENFLEKSKGVKPQLFVTELGGATATASQISYGSIDATNFAAVLHYIETDTKTRVLARPRVLTQNNEAAIIKLVTNAAIGINTVTIGQGSASTSTEQAERTEIGVTMKMTPQINEDNTVLLFLEPSVSTVAASAFSEGTADPTTRMVRTMARVKDNQTLVIGGLMEGQDTSIKRKMPFLGDLPGIGKFFSYNNVDNTDRELLVFVTPHIVRGATSLGERSATARGEDVAVRRMLDQFMDKEIDSIQSAYEGFEKTKQNFFSQEEELVRASERRFSDPVVERQITEALDALSPQIVDQKMSAAMDSMSLKK